MTSLSWLVPLCLALQVPPPAPNSDRSGAELKSAAKEIHQRESAALENLESKLTGPQRLAAAAEIQNFKAPRPQSAGATRLVPLAEVVPAPGKGLASVPNAGTGKPTEPRTKGDWKDQVQQIRSRSATELFSLAKRAASGSSPHLGMAAVCLREVLARQPDHPEARRLLGYIRYENGWARPFAVNRLKEGNVNHPIFGWVPAEWVPHLDGGELPAPGSRGNRRVQWLPAREADALRSDMKHPWQIATEHFEIRTDVPLNEAIEFGRRLEAFYDLFFTVMADVVGENLPLARRFRSPTLSGESSYRPHQVLYFATKDEYVEFLRPLVGNDIGQSLGYYNPPRPGKGNRAPAYFFRDLGGQLPVTATLYHEVSHQLLFETAGPNSYTKNVGNYWVFEGLGTYFETVTPLPDGAIEVGGMVGERIAAGRQSLAAGRFLPLDAFLRLDQNGFNRRDQIHAHYQQAMALAVFLMQWNDGAYRDAFLDYVHDAYRGRLKRTTGRSLEDRLGVPVNELDKQFRSFVAHAESKG